MINLNFPNLKPHPVFRGETKDSQVTQRSKDISFSGITKIDPISYTGINHVKSLWPLVLVAVPLMVLIGLDKIPGQGESDDNRRTFSFFA